MPTNEYFDRLIELRHTEEDENGDLVPSAVPSYAYSARVSVARAADFAAQTEGYKAERAYRMWTRDYNGEELLRDTLDGLTFRVRRAYERGGKTELTCEREVTVCLA